MLRFLQVLFINAWRGMRRANGTPAIIITLIAVSVLFIGSNASARASLQSAMHTVGLPVALPAAASELSGDGTSGSGKGTQQSDPKSSKKSDSHTYSSNTSGKNSTTTSGSHAASSQSLAGSVSLNPSSITPACAQGLQLYNVQFALLSFVQAPNASTRVNWNWETRVDSGTNSGASPVGNATHSSYVSADTQVYAINPEDPSQPLLSAAANPNYAYSFRLDITSPFTAESPWVSVPQASGTTCP